ncbi:hypothetical protein G5B31_00015 [Rhodobacter sp. SGA-6-6]|uniref:hypothetical protein n=1 Tax=Rhodobacter sp. SGA-6-6 TaxID=2710882 RepID=UPI0013EB9C4F|nr:hypothetical protein [Rhodobacter sp. SGA-6-6]NGM43910.1 hypothetical protein [Rhodobacter sp. SGA-6-6]
MSGPSRQDGLDVVLPLGKPGTGEVRGIPEMARFHDRALIEWAAEEAILAGATRIIMVSAEGFAAGPVLADRLRQFVRTHQARKGRHIRTALLVHPAAGGEEGWDGLIHMALRRCRGSVAVVVDPTTILLRDGKITTYTAFMLCRAAGDHGRRPLLAVATLPWEDALSLPVLTGPEERPPLTFDRPGDCDSLTVFAGRAVVPLPVPGDGPAPPPLYGQFPFEPLTQLLLARNGQMLRLPFRPVEFRHATDAETAAGPRGLLMTARLGLSALQ